MRVANQKSKSNQAWVTTRDGERVRNIAYKGPSRGMTTTVPRSTATTATVMSDLNHADPRESLDPNDPFLTDDERDEVQGKLEKQVDKTLPAEVTMAKSAAKKVLGKTKEFFTPKPSGPPTTGLRALDHAIDKSLTF